MWPLATVGPGLGLAEPQGGTALCIGQQEAVQRLGDNAIARWITWLRGSSTGDVQEEFTLSREQLDLMLAPVLELEFVDQVRAAAGSGVNSTDWIPALESAGAAGYYLMTGRDLEAERIVMHFLPHDQFVAASLNACMTDFLLMSLPEYASTYDSCRDFGGEVGFEKRVTGKNHVYVDLGESPIGGLYIAYVDWWDDLPRR